MHRRSIALANQRCRWRCVSSWFETCLIYSVLYMYSMDTRVLLIKKWRHKKMTLLLSGRGPASAYSTWWTPYGDAIMKKCTRFVKDLETPWSILRIGCCRFLLVLDSISWRKVKNRLMICPFRMSSAATVRTYEVKGLTRLKFNGAITCWYEVLQYFSMEQTTCGACRSNSLLAVDMKRDCSMTMTERR